MRVRRHGRVAASLGAGLLFLASALSLAPLASAQDPGEPVDLRGFATGQPGHTSVLEVGGTRAEDTEVAWSGASVDADADGLKGAKLNEMNRIFQPDKAGQLTYARGSGLEVGLGTDPTTTDNTVIVAGKAEQDAPPDNDAPTVEEIAVEGAPIAYASAVRGTALANSNDSGLVPDVCVLGDDLSRGTGYAADVQLLDTTGATDDDPQLDGALLALDDQDPDRAVSNSVSRTKLVPSGSPNNFGLMSEVRQTIAPITILQADDNDPATDPRAVTIEVLGEWVLRVVANGKDGGASVHYGPGKVSPQTPILKIIDSATPPGEVDPILSFQDIFGEEGLTSLVIPGLVEVAIGENPRAIAAPGGTPDPDSKPKIAANGTSASAAIDVVRVRLLPNLPDLQALDLRFGHMEASTEVPVGGVDCPIPVDKSADPENIRINEEPDSSEITITVHNVYDCDLEGVVLTDKITQHEGTPDFKLLSADPAAKSPDMPTGNLETATVTWELGTIKKGEEKSVTLELASVSRGGIVRDIATATGKMANCTGEDASGLAIAGLQLAGLSVPVDVNIETPLAITGGQAAQTVATGGGLVAAASALGLLVRRRGLKRKN